MSIILSPTPQHKVTRILCGTSVRKPLATVQAWLQTLQWQELPERTTLDFLFMLDTDDTAVADALAEVGMASGAGPRTADFDDTNGVTHQWQPSAMARVGQNKNRILRYAVENGYDAVWLVDADLLLDKTTLASLIACRAPIACAVYWTHWHNPAAVQGKLHSAPQVWLNHPYQLEGRGYDSAEFRRKLLDKQRTEVWGQGACSLIQTSVIQKGVSFDYLPGVSTEGMMAGEDRHFCLRAEGLHIPMIADAWPDIFHVYHPDDQQRIPEMLERLGATHPMTAGYGDWVSLYLEPLEPVMLQTPNGASLMQLPAQHARGRLGGLAMLPELEDRVAGMQRGESAILGLHFPTHHPQAYLRGQRRLVRVTVVDIKPYGFPPVVEEELLVGVAMADQTSLTLPQQQALAADQELAA